MATRSDLEERKRERYKRERRRRKRRKRVAAFVACVIVIGVVCVALNANKGKSKSENISSQTSGQQTIDNTQTANNSSVVITGYIDGKETGSTVIDYNKIEMEAAKSSLPENSAIPPANEENDLIEVIVNSGESKHCYLTFDDGPTTNITPQILDTLRRYNVKATFFEVGSLIKANPDLARRVYEEGHLIANHSQNHEYDKLYASSESFMKETDECFEEIKKITGEESYFKLVRFPGGGFNSSDDEYASVKQQSKQALKNKGYYFCDWNTLNGDAEGRTKDAGELLEYLKECSEGYNNLVVLMHDASTKQATANYLASAIEWLSSQGYTFHRLDDIEYVDKTSQDNQTEESEQDSKTEQTNQNN